MHGVAKASSRTQCFSFKVGGGWARGEKRISSPELDPIWRVAVRYLSSVFLGHSSDSPDTRSSEIRPPEREPFASKRHDIGQMIVITQQGEFERGSRRRSGNHMMCEFQAKDLESGRMGIPCAIIQQTKDLLTIYPFLCSIPRGKGYPTGSSIQPNGQVSVPKCRMLGLGAELHGSPLFVSQEPNLQSIIR